MRIFNTGIISEKLIIYFYFAIAMVEDITEFFSNKSLLIFVKPLSIIVLLFLYWFSSAKKSLLFFGLFLFLLMAKIYAIYDTEEMLFIGMTAFFFHRVIMIYYIVKLIKIKDCIPLFLAIIPFLFFFLYLLSLTSTNITPRNYFSLILQSILMSVLASMALSHYVMNNDKKDVWLLIFGLLSVAQYFLVFIDKFYLADLSPVVFRPLMVILTTLACFTFYKFVITTERLDNN